MIKHNRVILLASFFLVCINLFFFVSENSLFALDEKTSKKTKKSGIALLRETKLRIVSYNAYFTSIFPKDDGRTNMFKKLVQDKVSAEDRTKRFAQWAPKAHADIWAMQEVMYTNGSKGTSLEGIMKYFNKLTSQKWHGSADMSGRVILSKYPIIWSSPRKAFKNHGHAALIDLPNEVNKKDILIINLHLHWKNKRNRDEEAKSVVDFIVEVKNGTYPKINKDVPIMICGDFNSKSPDNPYNIIMKLSHDAKDNDKKPAQFNDTYPVQLGTRDKGTFGSVTWSGVVGDSSYTSAYGVIDYVLVPSNFMKVQQSFIFNSLILSKKLLKKYGVEREAILLKCENKKESVDHLPIFIDFKSKNK